MSKKIFIIFALLIVNALSQKCVEDDNFCKKCDLLTDLCNQCKFNNLIPDDKGGCTGAKKCELGKNYCDECNGEEKLCKSCEIGYFPDENGGCSYTNNCEISYNGECFKCKDNFILVGDKNHLKICKSISTQDLKNCKKINITNGLCDECEENFFLNYEDKKCSKTSNCSKSNYNFCSECISGFYLDIRLNKCIKQENQFLHCKQTLDGKLCDKCDDNYYIDEEQKCTNTNNCKASDNYKCKECINNYYLTEDKESCSSTSNCHSGDKKTGLCFSCSNNYYLQKDNRKCVSDEKQKEYKFCKIASDRCEQCEVGYHFGEDRKCVKSRNCAESENGVCATCSDGYYLGLDKKCTNKEHCIYSNSNGYCLECEDGYVWDNLHQICNVTEGKLKNCRITVEGEYCGSCKKNFYLNMTDSLCYDSTQKVEFYKCSRTSSSGTCFQCEDGYYFGYEDLKCSKIENCAMSQDENTCLKCRQYYCLDVKLGKCIDNKKILKEENKKYFKCKKTNKEGTACEECEEGLELNEEGLCLNKKDCIEMKDNNCLKCQDKKYSWRSSCLNNIFGCIYTNTKNCLRCDNILDFKSCTECQEGFKLNEDGKCI